MSSPLHISIVYTNGFSINYEGNENAMSATKKKIVHVVGTGTIGEPLIGILSTFREQWGLDDVTFHKRTALLTDRSKVLALAHKGAKLAVDKERWEKFKDMGMEPHYEAEEALERASVIVDCTPVGNQNKEQLYNRYAGNGRGF